MVEHDISMPLCIDEDLSLVANFAAIASPPRYLEKPIESLRTGSVGTENVLSIALEKRALILHASTSEVYGDPLVHPQPETYWGNVNPVGPRSVYDESKRFAEALVAAYHRKYNIPSIIVRIFNTYGPRMRMDDGRVITNFLSQALSRDFLTIYGNGSQTRSFCYIEDTIAGIYSLVESESGLGPYNIGNPEEISILDLARLVCSITGHNEDSLKMFRLPVDDPSRRKPDIAKVANATGWKPSISLEVGLSKTFRSFLQDPRL